ncbi:patatin-like phospholipase family protein [Proteiniclasticum sp. SCR006]|uniref:Patatin-like phospholipase family protein n=1 Tax=Proteiniclasticum aestuarii TaxID=2817862 RepID=A0A939H556_9CLOT|nr:patatin-like phospholipase family protein [Proteiniclasticum aestuarii]MBO1264407.1 patatin-like phospholipase family protein [Proteiniclasticum aestuarii]
MYGLALGGGGSRGSYEIGVLKALKEMNIEIGAITGTSIGAINGASFLMGDMELMEEIWKSLNRDSLIKFKDISIPDVIKNRGFDFDILMDLLKKHIKEEVIRSNPIDFGIVTYNLSTREPVVLFKEDIPEGKLVEYVGASANHPSFERLTIEGEAYIDGAVYNNIPVLPLHKKGYQDIIAVNLHTFGDWKSLKGPYNLVEIKSEKPLGSVLFPDPDTIRKNMTLGYLDTLKTFGKVHGYHYYFRTLDDFTLLNSLSAEEIRELRREVSPVFLNKTLGHYENKLREDYSLTLSGLEITAEVLRIDNTKIYAHQGELLDEILKAVHEVVRGTSRLPLKERIIFKELDATAFKALELAAPKIAIANLFLKILQNRIIGV